MAAGGLAGFVFLSKESWSQMHPSLATIGPIEALRGALLLVACTILAVNSIAVLHERFIPYGPRALSSGPADAAKSQTTRKSWFGSLLDWAASLNVPHGFFVHFYMLSVLSSVVWGFQLATKGRAFMAVASRLDDAALASPSMSINQVVLCWALLAAHGVRRLYECTTLTKKSSQSRMWVGHYAYGLMYYITMGIAIWIEGSATLVTPGKSLRDARLCAPSLKTFLFLPVFFIASGIQHDCHRYLASLKRYSLPTHPAFEWLVCPHYTAECAIYFSLSILAAPKGMVLNRTIFSVFILTVVSLGASAATTKDWYARKFGDDKVQGKWKMIPRLY